VPFVGTGRRSSRACTASVTRRVSVFGTEATVAREYTHALIRDYAQDCVVTLVGSKNCGLRRGRADGAPAADQAIRTEMRRASATTASAPTRSCSPAPTIRCCSIACGSSRPGR